MKHKTTNRSHRISSRSLWLAFLLLLGQAGFSQLMWNSNYPGWTAQDIIPIQDQGGNYTGYMACGVSSIYTKAPKGLPALLRLDLHGNVVQDEVYELNTGMNLRAYAVKQTFIGNTPSGFAFIASKSRPGSFELGGSMTALAAVDNNLNVVMSLRLSLGNKKCALTDFIIDSNGDYVLAGHAKIHSNRGFDVWIAKVSSTGTLLWSRTYGSAKDEFGYDIVEDANGGYAVTGSFNGPYSKECLLVHVDTNGGQDFIKHYGNSDHNPNSIGFGIATTNFGYAITGIAPTNSGSNYPFLVLTDFSGNYLQGHYYNYPSGTHHGLGVEVFPRLGSNGTYRYYISGTMDDQAMTLVTNGPVISHWKVAQNPFPTYAGFDPIYTNAINGASRTDDGGFIMGGHSEEKIWIVKVGLDGDPGCMVDNLPEPNVAELNSPLVVGTITLTSNDGPLVSNNGFIPDTWTTTLDLNCSEIGSNKQGSGEMEAPLAKMAGLSVFPNPSAGVFTIALAETEEQTRVDIFNLAGKKVAVLELEAGESKAVDLSVLPKGLYLARTMKGEVVKVQIQ